MIIELLPNKIGCFLTRLDEVRHLKVVEPHEVILGDFPFLIEKAICALVFFPKSIQSTCAQPSPLMGKSPTEIGHHM